MRAFTTTILAVAFMGSLVTSVPTYTERATGGSFTNFVPAGPNDLRSPCPAINAMANHGFLPHDGRGITLEILTAAVGEAFNVGADFAALTGGFALVHNTGPPHQEFTLEELSLHNSIEHDGSLSRSDAGDTIGDNHTFNQTAFDMVLAEVPNGQTTFDVQSAAAGRRARILSEHASDPSFQFTTKSAFLSYAETALYLAVLDSPNTLSPPVDFVKVLFEEERIPYNEGWRRSESRTDLPALLRIAAQLQHASTIPETIEQAFIISASTLRSIFG